MVPPLPRVTDAPSEILVCPARPLLSMLMVKSPPLIFRIPLPVKPPLMLEAPPFSRFRMPSVTLIIPVLIKVSVLVNSPPLPNVTVPVLVTAPTVCQGVIHIQATAAIAGHAIVMRSIRHRIPALLDSRLHPLSCGNSGTIDHQLQIIGIAGHIIGINQLQQNVTPILLKGCNSHTGRCHHCHYCWSGHSCGWHWLPCYRPAGWQTPPLAYQR